jgi:hypothetical protein
MLIMAKLKPSRLSYNGVVSFPPASIFKKSKYEVEVDDSVVSFTSSSLSKFTEVYRIYI